MITVGIILITLAIHPFVTYPLTLLIWSKFKPVEIRRNDVSFPSISVLCCCHNEEKTIESKIQNTLRITGAYPGVVDVLFFLDSCSDGTAQKIAALAPELKVVESAVRSGKSFGMRSLFGESTGELIVFTDANTLIDEAALTEFARDFSDPAVGCVCSTLTYSNPEEGETAEVNSLYWKLEEQTKKLETLTGTTIMADGGLFAIRRSLYVPTPNDIIDDMHTSLNVALGGARIVSSSFVHATERTTPNRRDEFSRKIRIACRAFNCYRLLRKKIDKSSPEFLYKFYSHKVIRWFSLPIALLGIALVGFDIAFHQHYTVFLVLTGLALGSIALGAARVKPFGSLLDVALSHLAVTIGILESIRGKRYTSWTPSASGR